MRFQSAIDSIVVDSLVQLKHDLVKIFYHLGSYQSFAISYISTPQKNRDTVTLYVPSSVPNSGYTTFYGQNEREKPVEEAQMIGDLFILEKPGDGVQALHNNYYNFNLTKVLPYIINMGNSYSKKYLIDALALSKYLKSKYKVFNIWGCSQGGSATLLISTLVKPTTAVVASGYSVKTLDFLWLHSNQLISTGVNKFFDPVSLPSKLNGTKLLFTFGKKEPDWYGLETRNHYTQDLFKSSKNIFVKYHSAGHKWPTQLVKEFYNLSE